MFNYSKKVLGHIFSGRRLRLRLMAFLLLLVFAVSAVGTLSVFSDRQTLTHTFKAATFHTDGYTLETSYEDIPYVADENIKVAIQESNNGDSALDSVVSLSVKWSSPDPDCQLFGQSTASNNATFSIAGQQISVYTVSGDKSTATLDLPAHTLDPGVANSARDLQIHIPDSLMGTGTIYVTFNGVTLQQSHGGFSGDIPAADLTDHNLTADVGWAASSISGDNGKALMGYLRSAGAGKYTIEYIPSMNYSSSGMKDFASATASRWSHYKDFVTALSFADGVTSIGNYCFADFTSVTSVSLPGSVTDIGISAFNGSGLTGELEIPATVTSIQSGAFANLPDVTTITFQHTLDTLTLPDNTSVGNERKGAFSVGSPHNQATPLRTKVNSSINNVLNYGWPQDFRGYTINVATDTNGSLSASSAVSVNGKTIILTPSANAGFAYTGATVTWAEDGAAKSKTLGADTLTFQMPASDVTVIPAFEQVSFNISYNLNGGSVSSANPTSYSTTTASFTLNNPTRTGYTFAGWTGSNGTTPQTTVTIAQGTKGDLSYSAVWTANTNTAYTVKHWTQNLGAAATQNSSNYSLNATENKTGTTASSVTPAVKSLTGFSAPSTQTVTIAANGSTVVNYYYTRNSYTVSVSHVIYGGNPYAETTFTTSSFTKQYGETWSFANNMTASAPNGTAHTHFGSGEYASSWTSYYIGNQVTQPARNTSVNCYYAPNSYTITYNMNGGTNSSSNPSSYDVLTGVTFANPTRSGYIFAGWTNTNGTKVTGINPGKNSSIAGDKMYSELASRTVGNQTITANWNVKPTPAAPTPTAASITSTRITLNTITDGEYSINGTTWQDSPVFSNLSMSTAYTFYARYKNTENHYQSAAGSARIATLGAQNLTITADNRSMVGYTGASGQNLVIPETVTQSDGMVYRVTAIADQAFQSCNGLSSVTVPASVTSIGYRAFGDCDNLTSVSFGSNSNLTSLGSLAFYNCKNLTGITIPSGVTSIGERTFWQCRNLTAVSFGSNSKLTFIGEEAFYYCDRLGSITIPSGVSNIDENAFQACKSLSNVTILSSSYSIGEMTFYNTNLSSIDLTGAVTIGVNAFAKTNLTSVILSTRLTYIDRFAFYNLDNLTVYFKGSEAQWNSISKHGDAFALAKPVYYVYNY